MSSSELELCKPPDKHSTLRCGQKLSALRDGSHRGRRASTLPGAVLGGLGNGAVVARVLPQPGRARAARPASGDVRRARGPAGDHPRGIQRGDVAARLRALHPQRARRRAQDGAGLRGRRTAQRLPADVAVASQGDRHQGHRADRGQVPQDRSRRRRGRRRCTRLLLLPGSPLEADPFHQPAGAAEQGAASARARGRHLPQRRGRAATGRHTALGAAGSPDVVHRARGAVHEGVLEYVARAKTHLHEDRHEHG
jgi:hypothetical protein